MSVRRTAAVAITGITLAIGVPTLAASAASPSHLTTHVTPAAASSLRLLTVGGRTMLKLNPNTAAVLTKNGVQVAPVSEARVVKSGIAFPIQGGIVNPANLHGHITHDGGLKFTAGGKNLTIRDFRVSITHQRLTAYVDQAKARIAVLNLHLGAAKVAAGKHRLVVSNVHTSLTKVAAGALNQYFGVNLFSKGLPIGKVRVSALIKAVHVG